MDNFDHFLLTVVYDIPALIFVIDPLDTRIIYANQYMRRLDANCVGRLFAEKFSSAGGDHFFVSYGQQPFSSADNGAADIPVQSEYFDDETETWYHVRQRPITWIDGTRKIACVLNEINALKRLQKNLSEAHASLAYKNRELELLAKTDRLTHLFNRHHLDAVLEQEFSRFQRTGKPFALFLADCDKFKLVNDNYGHQVGDLVLIDYASLLRESVRATDTVGRWGGEEFLAILPETQLAGAVQVAEKLRQMIAAHEFPIVGHKTASFGVAQLQDDESVKDLIARADEALYLAKQNGRNRVEALA